MTAEKNQKTNGALPASVEEELRQYGEWIKKFRAAEIGDIKMQKIRLQLGTYVQRQEGVQMQRIKFPGGVMTGAQLIKLAEVSKKFASGFIHFTTRQDAQLYYIQLEKCPDMMRELASAGITTREACGNTVRNITASYLSGVSPTEPFDVQPYCQALFQFLVRNKFNQVMGRKFKIAFEGCSEDLAGLRFHDIGLKAVVHKESGLERRGFRVYIGGGLGGMPAMGHLYSEFLPEEEMMNLAAATLRLFDRYGERKNRMAARMKFLVKKMGWEKFKEALDAERKQVKLDSSDNDYLKEARKTQVPLPMPQNLPVNPSGLEKTLGYQAWLRDCVVAHKFKGYRGVHVRLKLGDLVAETAYRLADITKIFSHDEIRISMHQNLFLSWVPEKSLPALFTALSEIGLTETGVETLEDTTTCPGADTCRLGITSAKGLGASISALMQNGLSKYKELTRNISVKISGCPNGCAQHGVANIGFQGAALKKDEKTVPSHDLFVGGSIALDKTSFAERIGKFPARNCPQVVEKLVELYASERKDSESFNACMTRVGKERIQKLLAPLAEIPSFQENPDFYQDWGHDNEKFAIRTGIKGECAGAPIQEKAPVMADAREKLAQAEAFFAHKEYDHSQLESYEVMAEAARVPLYAALVDPFTSDQSLWEFENIFVRAGRVSQEWLHISEKMESEKKQAGSEKNAQRLIALAKKFLAECETLHQEIQNSQKKPV